MHVDILWFTMHITVDNTVNSYAWVHLVVFYTYYWRKHGKQLCMGTFLWFSMHITGENTVNSYAC